MDRATRKSKLDEIKRDSSNIKMTGIPFNYHGEKRTENVYKIPLDYLIYNKYNGRIGSVVLSYEAQNEPLNPENDKDKSVVESFLYDSKPKRNDSTMNDLKNNGQQRYGIVTADGIIIDGNRRAMLLNRLYHKHNEFGIPLSEVEHCKYFLAIILPDDATERDIQKLETTYQMGEDKKLEYNAIEKYLKCKALKKCDYSDKDISDFMGESESDIKKWLETLKLMEEYLDVYGYSNIYTRLEKTEDQFLNLNDYLKSYTKGGANIKNMDWVPDETDLEDLKLVCFDYIRARYEGKEFREIGKTGKDGSVFFHKEIWNAFFNRYRDIHTDDEKSVEQLRQERPDESLSMLLKQRDDDWTKKYESALTNNLRRSISKLEDQRASDKPAELLDKALNALKAVNTEEDSFYNDSKILEVVMEINRMTYEMKKLLNH